jgi:hypothetical protein
VASLAACACLDDIYKPIVDEWHIWDSLEENFALAQSWDQS